MQALLKTETEDAEEPLKKKRKPNFTASERMHLAKSYVDNVDEYNRGFTSATRGDTKHGRQLLLEKWARELTAFGIAERTTVEVEQKLRDYVKKIVGNQKKPPKRPLSPAAELLATALPQCSTSSNHTSSEGTNGSSCGDPQTEYVNFLLSQQRGASSDSSEKDCCAIHGELNRGANNNTSVVNTPALDFSFQVDESVHLQLELLQQQVENAKMEGLLKNILLETARIEQSIKKVELEQKKLELQRLRQDRTYNGIGQKYVNGVAAIRNEKEE